MKPSLSIAQGQLRPSAANDLDDLLHLLHDAEVRRYLCDDTLLPRETVAAMLAENDQLDTQGLGSWVIEDAEGRFAGIVALQPVSEEAAEAPELAGGVEPLIALHPGHWGHGLAGEAVNAVIRHARETLGLARLVAAVDAPNEKSHTLMQRCGFTVMGRSPGPANELVLYELTLRP